MDILGAHLDAHESPQRREAIRSDRQKDQAWWNLKEATEAERLIAFESWCRTQIEKHLILPKIKIDRERRAGQCLVELKGMLLDLFQRGWLLDGARLAPHITAVLVDMSAAQHADRVRDFWPFFRRVVRSYVGIHAEELRIQSQSAGSIIKMALTDTFKAHRSLPELIAQEREEINETLRAKKTKAKQRQKQESDQGRLF